MLLRFLSPRLASLFLEMGFVVTTPRLSSLTSFRAFHPMKRSADDNGVKDPVITDFAFQQEYLTSYRSDIAEDLEEFRSAGQSRGRLVRKDPGP